MTRFLLLTTVDGGDPARFALCERLIASIAPQLSPEFALRHHVLIQNASGVEIGRRLAEAHPWLRLHQVKERLSLSRARNVLIELTRRSGELASADVVAFPDDDAWYPAPLLPELSRLFESPVRPDMFVCRYGSRPEPAAALEAHVSKPSLLRFVRCASSNTMFVRGEIVRELEPFDEILGVGAPIPGAEDLDYALRARLAGSRVLLSPNPLVGHRDRSPDLRARYYAADLLVLMRHATNDLAHAVLVGRKLLVGLYLVGCRRLSFAAWFNAVGQALRSRRRRSPPEPTGRPAHSLVACGRGEAGAGERTP